jgi:Cu(I)/Ag(I) efflux system membrane protein CusA/SilA
MLNRLTEISLSHRVIVVIGSLLFLVSGMMVASRLPVDVFPDLTAPTVTVITEAHGMATQEVEQLVTFPVETAVNGATGVRRVRSSTATGISIVWVEFDWGMDIFAARQIVAEKLQAVQAALPDDVDPPLLAPIGSIMGEIMVISVYSTDDDGTDPMALRSLADWTLRRRLLAVPGVSQVVPIGGEVRQYQVLVSPAKLTEYQVSLHEVLVAAGQSNANFSGGRFTEAGQEYLIRGTGRIRDAGDIGNAVIVTRGGTPVRIQDVAKVDVGPAIKFGDGSAEAKPAVVVVVQKQPNANTLELTRAVEATVQDVRRGLPADVVIDTHVFRQADFIQVAIDNVVEALAHGAILVIVVLFLFLWNLRATLISALAIPLSLVAAVFVFWLLDITINTMTLGGLAIAIGALVDDAIIYVENMFRRLKENRGRPVGERRHPDRVIFDAAAEIRGPMINATLIIVIVFVPLLWLSGVEGRLLQPMGTAYIASILASLLVALIVTPALSAFLLPGAKVLDKEGDSWLVTRFKIGYEHTLAVVLRIPGLVLLLSVAALVASLSILPSLGRSFLPEFNEGALVISVVTPPGTSLQESGKIGQRAERILLAHPEIQTTARRTGRAELDEHAQGVEASEIDARFELGDKDKEAFLEEVRASLSVLPGTNITIGQPIGHRIDHMLSGTRANIAVKIFGPDLQQLRGLAEAVRTQMEGIPGVVDLAVDQQVEVPQVRISPRREAMALYGVTVRDLAEFTDVAFTGEVVSQVLEQGQSYDMVVRFDEASRGSLERIRQGLVDTPAGPKVPLIQLADVSYDRGPNRVSRENGQRKIVVQANVAGNDLRSVVNEIESRLQSDVSFPEGYYVEFGGQFESEQAATRHLTIFTLIAIAAIFLILYMEFGSFRLALFTMANLPLALIGGIWSVYFTSGVVSVASLVGFITLFGIATRNGVLLISHCRNLVCDGAPLRQAIVQGSLERLSPIMMTALTAALALVPLALGGGAPGKEIQTPMAIVILGGLFSSTALNMIVLPGLLLRYGEGAMASAVEKANTSHVNA